MAKDENFPAAAGTRRHRIAVVGSGISGMSAAWLLNQTADVTLFEKAARIGGHTYTATVAAGDSSTAVDMGFIVYNEETYPNLTALFDHLGVTSQTTDMSLAVSLDNGRLEYGGGSLAQLFAQKRNLLRPRYWSMLRDLVRFYRTAAKDLPALERSGATLGAYLAANRYGVAFQQDHLLPMAAAIWSMPTSDVLNYPAHAFIQFHNNHGLLKLAGRPLWRTVSGGSQAYVERLMAPLGNRVRKGIGIQSIERLPDSVVLRTSEGSCEVFDQVVIATHADHALALLANPTAEERRVLSAFRYNDNCAILHSDARLMPKRRRAWASWNYIGGRQHDTSDLTVTYWMNSLQALSLDTPLFVTLNPDRDIDPAKIFKTERFEHPIIDTAATNAQQELWTLQGQDRLWYCGAYFGAGFHEDGLQSGLAVAEALSGHRRPWRVADPSGRIVVKPHRVSPSLEGALV
ncbi:MAG: NAD(P)/FAD-dependent oxidoreductase [Hyphomicrobiaceae bacterium]